MRLTETYHDLPINLN